MRTDKNHKRMHRGGAEDAEARLLSWVPLRLCGKYCFICVHLCPICG
jgi:hypothetical protein